MPNYLVAFFVLIATAFGGSSTHRSSYNPIIDRSMADTYRCYSPELIAPGWAKDVPGLTIYNNRSTPAAMWVEGHSIVIWKFNREAGRELPDYVIVDHGGVDREVSVLNPGERCNLVLPPTQVERGLRLWQLHFELYRPDNPMGEYKLDGITQRTHTVEHRCELAEEYQLSIFLTRSDQRLPFNLADRPFTAECR